MESIQKRLIENATLLRTLNEFPEAPSQNPLGCESDETRQLSSERERQLADCFASISATTDNMRRVMAVRVEEDPDRKGLTVRLASNTGDLSSVKEGFGGIANTLEKAALRTESRITARSHLLRQIVMLDVARILSRLRSKHAAITRKTAGKSALLTLLNRTIHSPSVNPGGKPAKTRLSKAKSQSHRLSKTFDTFEAVYESHDPSSLSIDILMDCLVQAQEFDVTNLQTVLRTLSIDPNLKTSLPEGVSKLGWYYCITCDLIDAARSPQYILFERISIVTLEEPAMNISRTADGRASFDAVLGRIISLSSIQHDWQDAPRSLPTARTRFHARMFQCPTVHAEIQLLFFYERNPGMRHPRTISSSKSACYLCDLFIRSHGEFHTPRTHGKLYDRWMLPEWPDGQSPVSERILLAIKRVNAAVEAKIVQSLDGKRFPGYHPNESVLPLREPWSSHSTLPLAEREQTTPEVPNPGFRETPSRRSSSHDSRPLFETDRRNGLQATCEPSILQEAPSYREQGPTPEPATPATAPAPMSRGDVLYRELTRGSEDIILQIDDLNLHVSWDNYSHRLEPNDANTSTACGSCWVQVTWLAQGIQITTDDDEEYDRVDLSTLANGHSRTVQGGAICGSKALALRNGEHTIILQYCTEGPRRD